MKDKVNQESSVTPIGEPQQTAQVPVGQTSKNKPLLIVGIALGFLLFGVGGYLLGMQRSGQEGITNNTIIPTQPPSSQKPSPTSALQPTQPVNTKQYSFSEIGLSMTVPTSLYVFEGVREGDNPPFTLFIQNYNDQNPLPQGETMFQMYFLVDNNPNITPQQKLEYTKSELEPSSIEEVTVDGHTVVRGQVKGQRNRFYSAIITNKGLIEIYTSEPTTENEQLANSIISTFKFSK